MQKSDQYRWFIKNYWNYYRELEDEFIQTKRYVDFCEDNFMVYSVEFLKLYQAVCSEIDVIGKSMANLTNSSFKAEDKKNNIYKWWYEIQATYTIAKDSPYKNPPEVPEIGLTDYICTFLDSFELQPWANFEVETYVAADHSLRYRLKQGKSLPAWWADYNSVKHNRTSAVNGESNSTNYRKANFGNLSNAFAALYTLEIAYMESVGTRDELEAFADTSILFVKVENATTSEIEALFV